MGAVIGALQKVRCSVFENRISMRYTFLNGDIRALRLVSILLDSDTAQGGGMWYAPPQKRKVSALNTGGDRSNEK